MFIVNTCLSPKKKSEHNICYFNRNKKKKKENLRWQLHKRINMDIFKRINMVLVKHCINLYSVSGGVHSTVSFRAGTVRFGGFGLEKEKQFTQWRNKGTSTPTLGQCVCRKMRKGNRRRRKQLLYL